MSPPQTSSSIIGFPTAELHIPRPASDDRLAQNLPALIEPQKISTTSTYWAELVAFTLAAIIGVYLRITISQLGYTDDLQEWHIVTELTLAGKSVYASTDRFSYAPTCIVLLHALGWIQAKLHIAPAGPAAFHAVIASALSIADVMVAACVLSRSGLFAAIFLVLNPVLILLTGFHSQVDTLAILPALASWMLIEPKLKASSAIGHRRMLASAALMALSLTIKHVMLFFPLWILFAGGSIHNRRIRGLYAGCAYGLFLISFVPFSLAPGAIAGIWTHVFNYTGLPSKQTLIAVATNLIVPMATIERLVPGAAVLIHKLVFMAGMCVIGRFIARNRPLEMFDRYLLAMMTMLPSTAPQYLAIPLVACAVMSRRWPAWVYTLAGLAYLLVSPWNFFAHYFHTGRWTITQLYQEYSFWHVQFWAAALLASGWLMLRMRREPGVASRPTRT